MRRLPRKLLRFLEGGGGGGLLNAGLCCARGPFLMCPGGGTWGGLLKGWTSFNLIDSNSICLSLFSTVLVTSTPSWLFINDMSWSESSQTITDLKWHATSCQATPSRNLSFNTARQASSWYSCKPSMVTPMSNSVSMGPSFNPSKLSGCGFPDLHVIVHLFDRNYNLFISYSPVKLQNDSGWGWFVEGIRLFAAPAQNHPLILMGCKCSASHPFPLKLHFRPEV